MAHNPKTTLTQLASLAKLVAGRAYIASCKMQEWSEASEVKGRMLVGQLVEMDKLLAAYKPGVKSRQRFDWSKALELQATGMSVREIAKRLGVSRKSIQYALRRSDVAALPSRSENAISMKRPMLVVAYSVGMTLGAIGQHYGVSGKTIARNLRLAGCRVRKPGSIRELPTKDELRDAASRADDVGDFILAKLIEALPTSEKPKRCPTCNGTVHLTCGDNVASRQAGRD